MLACLLYTVRLTILLCRVDISDQVSDILAGTQSKSAFFLLLPLVLKFPMHLGTYHSTDSVFL